MQCEKKLSEAEKRERRIEAQKTREYAMGFRGFEIKAACPFPIGSGAARTRWWDGWYDAKFVGMYGREWLSL